MTMRRPRVSTLIIVGSTLAAFMAALCISLRHGAAMGTFPDWLQGVGTVGAFSAGLLLLGRQLREHSASEDDRRRRHASAVSAWCILRPPPGDPEDPAVMFAAMPDRLRVQYANGGTAPVYGLNIYVGSHWGVDATWTRHWAARVVPPHHVAEIDIAADLSPALADWPPIEIIFTDVEGRHWRRDGRLQLHSLNEHPHPQPFRDPPSPDAVVAQ